MEGAGVVHSVGAKVKEFSLGDRVAFAHAPRANAEYVSVPAWKLIALPEDVSFDDAASILLQGLTAHYLTHDSYKVTKQDTVLVHSASGGVGLLLLQICKNLGAQVIGTVSSREKVGLVEKTGADHVVVRSEADWKDAVLKLTEGRGVNVAYDAIGKTVEESLSVVRAHGTVVYYGQAGGLPPKIDPNLLMAESKTLTGGELWSHIASREELLRRSDLIFSLMKSKKLFPHIFEKYPLTSTSKAHRSLESGKTQGKILLLNDL
jgi:NADPH2:quinone reductase